MCDPLYSFIEIQQMKFIVFPKPSIPMLAILVTVLVPLILFTLFHMYRNPTCLRLDHISGFILNVPSDYRLGFVLLPLRRRHWVAIRQIAGAYYNLDSKLDMPLLIGQVCIVNCIIEFHLTNLFHTDVVFVVNTLLCRVFLCCANLVLYQL